MIKVLHVTEDHSARNTGITTAVDALTRCVPEAIQPVIACVGDELLPAAAQVDLSVLPTRGVGRAWRFSPGGAALLARLVREADVVHIHGLWMWMQWSAARLASRMGKPFIVTAHGMLEPWIWQRQSVLHRLKKFFYWNGIAYPTYRRASAVHALTEQEAATLAGYFPGKRPVVIPHGIDLQSVDQALADLPPSNPGETPYFLFLGRLHPVKAIHLLIRAFARLPDRTFHLRIAGPAQPKEQAYADSLRSLVADLGLSERVSLIGPVDSAQKWRLYRDAWAFCLPSFSEVIGMVNLEAGAASTPVLTSFESGVSADWERYGGLRVHPEEESILAGLRQAAAWNLDERRERGMAMRVLINNEYSWTRVGQDWANLYRQLAKSEYEYE